MENKKGVSPVIATVLLIAIVVVLGILIFMWSKGFVEEVISKNNMPSHQVCYEIEFTAVRIGSNLIITNDGDIPIFQLEIKQKTGGDIMVKRYLENIPAGQTTQPISLDGNPDEVEVVPVFLGTNKDGERKAYTCENGKIAKTP